MCSACKGSYNLYNKVTFQAPRRFRQAHRLLEVLQGETSSITRWGDVSGEERLEDHGLGKPEEQPETSRKD